MTAGHRPLARHALPLALSLGLAYAPAARAQEQPVDSLLTVEKYLDFEQVADPQLSPDGTRIVYTRRAVNKLEDRWDAGLWIVNADGTRNRFLGKGSSPVWSPDGTRIAYVAEGEPKGAQVFVRYMDAEGATTQVTRLEQAPANVKWSPDGKWISFASLVPKSAPWTISLPAAPKGAKWTNAPRHVDRLHYRQDRVGFMESGYTHLFVVPADGGTPRPVTSGDWNVGARFDFLAQGVGYSWAPDGRTIYVEGFADSTADRNYVDSHVYAVDVASGRRRQLTTEAGSWGAPVVSPDGRRIAYRGYATAGRPSYHTSELYVMNADGSGARKASGDLDRDVGTVFWSPDGAAVYWSGEDRGTTQLFVATMSDGRARMVTSGPQLLTLTSMARGVGVGTRATAQSPIDVVRYDFRAVGAAPAVAQLTRVNEDLLSSVRLGQVEEIWYPSTGGARVQGFVVKPPSFDPSKKYPLIMEIHGGPHGMYNTGFSFMYQNFAANGYVVLYTNPRGSTGFGSAFGNAIQRRYPGVDYDDLIAGVDTVVRRGYVDTTRMYVGGCSGGGVLSSWVIGHTDRFAAAAVRCPVINWLSFAGQTDVPLFTYNFFDKPFWEDPKPWLETSPLMYVGNVTTPTLIMTGELDLRTPMAQSEEYYAALQMRGVPSSLLRFEGEFHGTSSKPSNFLRTQLYMMSWYERWRREGKAVQRTAAKPQITP
jgi:dipeptidyl aminopeptidase/acylaminoacyl peptidase